jgi:hypothetical protein
MLTAPPLALQSRTFETSARGRAEYTQIQRDCLDMYPLIHLAGSRANMKLLTFLVDRTIPVSHFRKNNVEKRISGN